MKQEDKELLLKDLCARLPYGVIVETQLVNAPRAKYPVLKVLQSHMLCDFMQTIENVIHKPYLFPLSSMTEEQWREFFKTAGYEVREEDCGRHTEMYYYDLVGRDNILYPSCDGIDWLNAHHFDYRGLIEKSLALDATGLNIY